jgi:RHS repeat-associated protein
MKVLLFFWLVFCYQSLFSELSYELDHRNCLKEISIRHHGKIHYDYDHLHRLTQVRRSNENGETLYSCKYVYNEKNELIEEKLIKNLGSIHYFSSKTISPYHVELFSEDPFFHQLDQNQFNYAVLKKSIPSAPSSTLKQIEEKYFYHSSQLRETKEELIYSIHQEEIAIFSKEGELIELKVPGLPIFLGLSKPCAIEKNGEIYAPIIDKHHNLYALIHTQTKQVLKQYVDPYGSQLLTQKPLSRFSYRGKVFDPELKLVFFGFRYYDPASRKWLTEDPIGSIQHEDLYNYCLDEPWKYIDPDGRFCIAIPIIGSFTLLDTIIDIAVGTAISISTDYILPKIELWMDKKTDEKRINEFLKIQKGETN